MTQASTALKTLTPRQSNLLIKVLVALLDHDGELSEYALEVQYKAGTPRQLQALVRKGVLTVRQGRMVMPVGPYAGQWVGQAFYSVA